MALASLTLNKQALEEWDSSQVNLITLRTNLLNGICTQESFSQSQSTGPRSQCKTNMP
jgi:hypothetical protein